MSRYIFAGGTLESEALAHLLLAASADNSCGNVCVGDGGRAGGRGVSVGTLGSAVVMVV